MLMARRTSRWQARHLAEGLRPGTVGSGAMEGGVAVGGAVEGAAAAVVGGVVAVGGAAAGYCVQESIQLP
jgi:hypothetical protein